MQQTARTNDTANRLRTDMLLRGIILTLLAAGIVALAVIWAFEAHFGLLDELCRTAYPTTFGVFVTGALILYRWPQTIGIARWTAFLAINALLFLQFVTALRGGGPLVGNYALVSMLVWLPLAYAISLLTLDIRHAPWAAGTLLAGTAATSIEYLVDSDHIASSDFALLINVFASHLVLLACLSGLLKFRRALAKSDADSHKLVEQASTDPLTGLANRRHGLKMLREAALAHRSETPSAVILCDIDHFKQINDRHGHDIGDKVVLGIAGVLRNNTRDVDTVVRWGGDEYLLVVPRIGAPALVELAERLRTRASAIAWDDLDACDLQPRISLGIAARVEGEEIDDWIKRADLALYQAKAEGRNRYAFAPAAPHAGPAAGVPGTTAA
jgi:diguanylate cyclase